MSFINTEEPLEIGKNYQYKEGSDIVDVELVEDNSDDKMWRFVFMPLHPYPEYWEMADDEKLEVEMMKGNFYFPTMPRIWDEDEY